jgi:hypothetical protein
LGSQPPTASRDRRLRALAPARVPPLTGLLIAALIACLLAAADADAAGFGVSKWEAGTCTNEECTDKTSSLFYTQAAGHPNFGITDFRFEAEESEGFDGKKVYRPIGHVRDVRVDLPSGLAVNPEATPACGEAQIAAEKSLCPPGSKVGEDEATGTVEANEAVLKLLGLPKLPLGQTSTPVTVTERFPVYDMQRRPGEAARFGVEVNSPTIELLKLQSVVYLEGGLSWFHEAEAPGGESSGVGSGDYHELFKIRDIPSTPELVESKLIFWGRPHEHNPFAPDRSFITLPSACNGPQTTFLHVDSHEAPGAFLAYGNRTPVGASGCELLEFAPRIAQRPETTRSDAPDGSEVDVHVPQGTEQPARPNSPDLLESKVTLPAGMTLNPSAASGLQACADAQFKLGGDEPVECPPGSVIGTVSVDAPGIPNGSLTGSVYLGTPKSDQPASGQEYRILVAAAAPAYGVGVRLEGRTSADPTTGRLTTAFSNLPPVPFEDFLLKFKGGGAAPLANPLACGPALTSASLLPYSGEPPATPLRPFTVDFDGRGGACPSPLPFGVSQGTSASSTAAGSHTSFTLALSRDQGQQYISALSTTLPEGLIGEIPAAARCSEAQVTTRSCPADSRIGSASVTVGSGPSPFALPAAPVYLTGPNGGAPFGLAIFTGATKVGPFDYGVITTRAKIEIDPYTARVTVVSALPTIVGGALIRLRSLSVTVDRPGFLIDPTSCAPLSVDTALSSTFGDGGGVASPFQATGCGSLRFRPSFRVFTKARTSRRFGASLRVSVSERAGEANIRSVAVMLPRKLAARLSTLKLACPAGVFAADPLSCPRDSSVGAVSASTPALPGTLSGPAFVVSHGGAAFPDLDLVLRGDGVTVVLVGNTNIKGGYTHSTFASLPDVPIKDFELSLPTGPHSALAANGNLCKGRLFMPTTITAQNGKQLFQRTRIHVAGCKRRRHAKSKHRHHRHRRASARRPGQHPATH